MERCALSPIDRFSGVRVNTSHTTIIWPGFIHPLSLNRLLRRTLPSILLGGDRTIGFPVDDESTICGFVVKGNVCQWVDTRMSTLGRKLIKDISAGDIEPLVLFFKAKRRLRHEVLDYEFRIANPDTLAGFTALSLCVPHHVVTYDALRRFIGRTIIIPLSVYGEAQNLPDTLLELAQQIRLDHVR